MNEEVLAAVVKSFKRHFGGEPLTFKSPGRINLIGEHTDYNNGFVLPAAVNQSIYFAISASDDKSTLISLDLNDSLEFSVDNLVLKRGKPWTSYIIGVVAEIIKTGRNPGNFNMVFGGDLPQEAGMSSSAALECGTCFALNELFDLSIPKLEMIKISQLAEHNYTGVLCGIMDQFASMMGIADQALFLDCETLSYKHLPVQSDSYSIVLCNSNVSHNLAESEYNVRRSQCEEAVSILSGLLLDVHSLREVSFDQLEIYKNHLPEVIYRRSRYIIQENDRVLKMTAAMEANNFEIFGEILKQAQYGMQSDYEISCPEIDFMADFANSRSDVLGARMMGGGFGGCTINLIYKGAEDQFITELDQAYEAKFQKRISPIKVKISDGVKRV